MDYSNFTLEELALKMKTIKSELDAAKSISGELQATWDELRKKWLVDKMEEMGIESVRITGVGTVSQRVDAYCTVPAASKRALYDWLQEHDFGDLITDTVNSSTLKAWMKEQTLKGNEVPSDEIVKFTPYTYVAITK